MSSGPKRNGHGGGRPMVHGMRALENRYRRNQLDGRSKIAKVIQAIANDLAEDRGGWAACSAGEAILIQRAAFLTLLCGSLESWALKQPSMIAKGELLAPLRRGYGTHAENLRRTLEGLGLKANRDPVPDLGEYLRAREQDQATRDDHDSRQGRNGRPEAPAAPGANESV